MRFREGLHRPGSLGRLRFARFVLLWGLLVSERVVAHEMPDLTNVQEQALRLTSEESPYAVRWHFLKSNERRHDLFFSALARLGGSYLGVGADQNYTLAAAASAEFVFLVDIDAEVIRWHKIYAALIPLCQTPQDLLALLKPRAETIAKDALFHRWPMEAPELFKSYRARRHMLFLHLSVEQTVLRNGRGVTWMSNPAFFEHVRKLMLTRRVVARVGDLHGEKTLLAIGQAARALDSNVRAVYLSNVEQWFRYSPQFRRNLVQLPHDRRTLVLRTLARGDVPAPDEDRWHFSIQSLDEFIARMDSPVRKLRRVQDLVPDMAKAKRPGLRGLSWLGELPNPIPVPWHHLPPLRGPSP